jgi:hypothetical protein
MCPQILVKFIDAKSYEYAFNGYPVVNVDRLTNVDGQANRRIFANFHYESAKEKRSSGKN